MSPVGARWGPWLAAMLCVGCGRIGYDALDRPDVLDDLLLRLSFDATVTRDDSGGGHDARCVGPCPSTVPGGLWGAALDQAGGSAHMRVDDDGAFQTPDAFTVAGWVRPTAEITSRTCIFTKPLGGTSLNSWALCVDPGPSPLGFVCGPAGCDRMRPPSAVAAGGWLHLAITFDGATRIFYVDGLEVARSSGAVDFDASPLVIGGDDDGRFGFSTPGLVEELRLYGVALSSGDVAIVATP